MKERERVRLFYGSVETELLASTHAEMKERERVRLLYCSVETELVASTQSCGLALTTFFDLLPSRGSIVKQAWEQTHNSCARSSIYTDVTHHAIA